MLFLTTRLLDAGDIMQTLSGWTVLGYGVSQLPMIRLPFWRQRNFRKNNIETHNGIQAMNQALSNLSLINIANVTLYLLASKLAAVWYKCLVCHGHSRNNNARIPFGVEVTFWLIIQSSGTVSCDGLLLLDA